MELTLELCYDRPAMTAMARALRVGLQAEQDKRSRIIGWGIVILTALILLFSGKLGWVQLLGWIITIALGAYLYWQDTANAILALRKLPENMRHGQWLFREDGYYSNTPAGESDYSYKNIFAMVESSGYLFLVFFEGRAHILNLNTIQGGTAEDLRRLLRKHTSLTIQKV